MYNIFQRKCDKQDCSEPQGIFVILNGCGHSFHTNCLPVGDTACLICKDEIADSIQEFAKKANNGLHHKNEQAKIVHEAADGGYVDEEEESDIESDDECSSDNDTLLRLKQQIIKWGLVPGL